MRMHSKAGSRRAQVSAAAVLVIALCGACSNELSLSANVDYRTNSCAGLGREFGRYLDAEIAHIEKTGEAKYFVAERTGQPPLIRDVLSGSDSGVPEDKLSLVFVAPAGHLRELGEAITARDLDCSAEDLATASENEISDKVKERLLDGLQPPASGPAGSKADKTWADWWEVYGPVAVSAPQPRPKLKVSEHGPDF